MARALWAGPGARRALVAGAAGAVEIALAPGGYVRLGEHAWVLVATARAPRGPLSLVVAGLEAAPLRAGAPATVTDGAVVVEGAPPIALPAAAAAARTAPPGLAPGWRAALAAAVAAAPAPPPELEPGLGRLRAGDEPAGVAALAGRGPGLTPAGDDALAGFAAWRHAAGAPVALPAGRCSPLGAAYLRCAQRGELPEVAARVLDAIRAGDAARAARRARALRQWGASSGAAILWGAEAAAGA
jgi:hypothetical protein